MSNASMDFFQHQDRARRKTAELVVMFALAVAGIVSALYLASRVVLRYAMSNSEAPVTYAWWDPWAFVLVAVGGLLFILLMTAYKTATLRSGGSAVAEMLGGRAVDPNTQDPGERRLLNVVEEMSLASGVPVPKVYLLDREEGINAFAAGYSTADAAVAVTRGCVKHLKRDELQGVIAHEFGHVLSGDMRLNLRLIGVLFGIFAIGFIGVVLARTSGGVRGSRRGLPVLALAGVLLMIIGYAGTFVGRLIQSAVCRQREYLADSSSVQFTRNPPGLAGALKKIGGLAHGSRLEAPEAQQASHLFFAQGVKAGLLATHPPLVERIRRLEPSFNGEFPEVSPTGVGWEEPPGPAMGLAQARTVTADPADIRGRVGAPTEGALRVSASLLQSIPAPVRLALGTPTGARTVLYALLLDRDGSERELQMAALRERLEPGLVGAVGVLYPAVEALPAPLHLPLVDLAMPALQNLSDEERRSFLDCVEVLILSDRKVTVFEFSVRWILEHRLALDPGSSGRISIHSLEPVLGDLSVLLSALAHAGAPGDAGGARRAFDLGVSSVVDPGRVALPFLRPEEVSLEALGRAFDRISDAAFEVRGQVITACAHVAFADRTVNAGEAELLRAFSAALDCPLPPLLDLPRAA